MCPESAVPTIATIGDAIAGGDRVAHYLHAQSEAAAFRPSGQRICRMHGAHQLDRFGADLGFSNISVHRGRESEKAVVLQQFLLGSGTPRCRQSVRWSGLNLKRLRAARWLLALMAATSPRMRRRCYWGKSIAACAGRAGLRRASPTGAIRAL